MCKSVKEIKTISQEEQIKQLEAETDFAGFVIKEIEKAKIDVALHCILTIKTLGLGNQDQVIGVIKRTYNLTDDQIKKEFDDFLALKAQVFGTVSKPKDDKDGK